MTSPGGPPDRPPARAAHASGVEVDESVLAPFPERTLGAVGGVLLHLIVAPESIKSVISATNS